MPRGTYVHLTDTGPVEERFQCAPGPGGWRYASTRSDGARVDLTVDSVWRQIRIELATSAWLIRGGLAGHDLLWVRHPAPPGTTEPTEHRERAAGFLADSPAFRIAVARHLALSPAEDRRVRLVHVQGPSLSTLTVDQRWRLAEIDTYETETAPLPVERYEVTDLSTAETHAFHLAGDVVLEAPALELADLESPPNLT
ncbi:hypothetical protein [Thermomonospora cellulosilytica]|uniref:Uncharacterized protein n=1 Tax=Thermomonospora cellulosilytica TaxID=1411118 RepID=A0A7W3N5I3_9ACTN|nr:hypothetical protein [Thermomonospora cellulosilytica]MBA9007900.1 hypothetical protein [Thermomonospora cellulosilytica]